MNKAKLFKRILFVCLTGLCIICAAQPVCAQDTLQLKKETRYYRTYFQNLIVRVYSARKYTTLTMRATDNTPDFKYRPNTFNGLGVGVTYRAITINLGYGFGFLLNNKDKGRTRAFDLQTRLYASTWAIDGYIKSYRGYYLVPKGMAVSEGSKTSDYYIRPDMKVRLFGASAYRIFNGKGFSLRPAFVQDVKQKKSGGSFFAGGEWFYVNTRADSSLVPTMYATSEYKTFSRMNMLQIGPGAGYAYTKVLPNNFFATGYLTANVNASLLQETKGSTISLRTGLNTNLLYRFALGWDNGEYSVVTYVMNNKIGFKGTAYNYTMNTGNVRIMVARRFKSPREIRKSLKFFNILVD